LISVYTHHNILNVGDRVDLLLACLRKNAQILFPIRFRLKQCEMLDMCFLHRFESNDKNCCKNNILACFVKIIIIISS